MIEWQVLGTYLGRSVFVAEEAGNDLRRIETYLPGTLLMAYFSSPSFEGVHLKNLVRALLDAEPLGLLLSGSGAKKAFDSAIDILSESEHRPQILTKYLAEEDLKEVAQDFLWASWPSEDRIDDWTDYRVLVFGAGCFSQVSDSIGELCDND